MYPSSVFRDTTCMFCNFWTTCNVLVIILITGVRYVVTTFWSLISYISKRNLSENLKKIWIMRSLNFKIWFEVTSCIDNLSLLILCTLLSLRRENGNDNSWRAVFIWINIHDRRTSIPLTIIHLWQRTLKIVFKVR